MLCLQPDPRKLQDHRGHIQQNIRYGVELCFTPFTVESIYSAANLQLIEGRCGELARAFGLDYSGRTWAAGDVVDYRDLNRWEAPFELMQHYESQTAETLKIRRCGAFSCGDNTAYYR